MDARVHRLERHFENVYLLAKTFAALEIHESTAIADTLLSLSATLLGREHGVLLIGTGDGFQIEAVRGGCRITAVSQAFPLWQRLSDEQIAQIVTTDECLRFGLDTSSLCTHGLAVVALSERDRVRGILAIGSSPREDPFDDTDLAFLTAVAGIGGLAFSAGALVLAEASLSRELEKTAAAERHQAEEKGRVIDELDQKLQIIENQHREILTLSAPILDVGPETLAVPLIGAFDAQRADEIMGRLLEEVASRQARFVLFDMTSVEDVDPAMASHFVKLVSAVALMGAEGMVTGIRPRVAKVMVELGVDLGKVRSLPTLRQGIAVARRGNSEGKNAQYVR
ncbi:MAG TPA: STAS domain-containing protein [Polyangium sp.]|nr:STAS domain-containing protein [Polyangium sp.]